MKTRTVAALIAIVSVVYAVAVIAKAHALLFSESVGYLYHPQTDRLFRLRLSPAVLEPAELFNPFARVLYDNIVSADDLGSFADAVADRQEDLRLRRESPATWREHRQAERRERLQALRRRLEVGPEFDIVVEFPRPGRRGPHPLPPLPPELHGLRPFAEGGTPGVVVVDAVHVRIRPEDPTSTEFFDSVVFVRAPRAAQQISQQVSPD